MFKYKKLNKLIFILCVTYIISIFFISVYQVNQYRNTFLDIFNEISEKFCQHIIDVLNRNKYSINEESLSNFYKKELLEHTEHFNIVNIKMFNADKRVIFDTNINSYVKHLNEIFNSNHITQAIDGLNISKVEFIDADSEQNIHFNKNNLYNNKYYVLYKYIYVIYHVNDYTYKKTIKGFMVTYMDITGKYIILYNNIQKIYLIGILSILFIMFTLGFFMHLYTKILANDEKLKLDLEQALSESRSINILKDRFISTVSHEMRTPTQSIIGFLELIKSDIEDELNKDNSKTNIEFLMKLLDNINVSLGSSENLIFLINNILDYSKITAGKFTLNKVTFDFCEMRKDFFDMFKLSAIKKNINITYNRNDQIPKYLVGDVNRIKQIFINLIGNAIKFTPENGNIELSIDIESIDKKNVILLFTIKDNGIGIDISTQESIFKPFIQANNTVSSGTGLGLTITKELIELMGGKIWFDSKINEGTTFYFTLKLEIGNEKDIKYDDKEDINYMSKYDKILKILLVDDDKFIQQFVKKILNKQKHIVAIANNGVEAIEMLSKSNFDIVIMDKQMPLLDGIETTIIIRNRTTNVLNHNIPIIAMTAISGEKDKKLLFNAGVNDIIIKPVKSIDLLTKLYKLVK